MTTFRRGDVVLVLFPNSDLLTAKKRPALIVQADDLQTGIPQVIVAMITSNMSRANHKCRVSVSIDSPDNRASGLQLDSVVVTDNLATVQSNFIHKVLGRFPAMADVDTALAHTFGLNVS